MKAAAPREAFGIYPLFRALDWSQAIGFPVLIIVQGHRTRNCHKCVKTFNTFRHE
jgi:hypothetical protein